MLDVPASIHSFFFMLKNLWGCLDNLICENVALNALLLEKNHKVLDQFMN